MCCTCGQLLHTKDDGVWVKYVVLVYLVTGRHRFSATFLDDRIAYGIFGRKMNLLPQIFKVLLKIYRESIKKQ